MLVYVRNKKGEAFMPCQPRCEVIHRSASYKKLSLIQKANTLLLETRREETQEGVG
jgi:uncharacterized C2H2 Zn-finger protein